MMEELYMAGTDGQLSFMETDGNIIVEQGSQNFVSPVQNPSNVIYATQPVYLVQQPTQQTAARQCIVQSQPQIYRSTTNQGQGQVFIVQPNPQSTNFIVQSNQSGVFHNVGNQQQRPVNQNLNQEHYLKQLEQKSQQQGCTSGRGRRRSNIAQQRRRASQQLNNPSVKVPHNNSSTYQSPLLPVMVNGSQAMSTTKNEDGSVTLSMPDGADMEVEESLQLATETASLPKPSNPSVLQQKVSIQTSQPSPKFTEQRRVLSRSGPQVVTTENQNIVCNAVKEQQNSPNLLQRQQQPATIIKQNLQVHGLQNAKVRQQICSGMTQEISNVKNCNKKIKDLPSKRIGIKVGQNYHIISNEDSSSSSEAVTVFSGKKQLNTQRTIPSGNIRVGNDKKENSTKAPGTLALCSHCGILSENHVQCFRCNRPMGKARTVTLIEEQTANSAANINSGTIQLTGVPASGIGINKQNFYSQSAVLNRRQINERRPPITTVPTKGRGRGRGKPGKSVDEPEVLILSSDDEDSGSNQSSSQIETSETPGVRQIEPLNKKEPIIFTNNNNNVSSDVEVGGLKEMESLNTNNIIGMFVDLNCRSIRIGSYKCIPTQNVLFFGQGIRISVPPPYSDEPSMDLNIPIESVLKILCHYGASVPVFFLYIKPATATYFRKILNMTDKKTFYFDTCSDKECHRRITILPEKVNDDLKNMMKQLYSVDSSEEDSQSLLLEELSQREANEILVRSCPIDDIGQLKGLNVNYDEPKVLLVYPPPPNKGGISLYIGDYACLEEEQFLNDAIIDFYLKWLLISKLSEKDRIRTHVFSTFFYKRLTSKPKKPRRIGSVEDDPNLSPAQKRHARVKSWTKGVDIFDKDFIIVPINEHSHWFLAIICFPGLSGPVRVSDSHPLPNIAKQKKEKKCKNASKNEIPIVDDGEWSDRDEAEGDDDELDESDDEEEDSTDDKTKKVKFNDAVQSTIPKTKFKRDPSLAIKQPCVLIFDSLAGANRSRIVATLREYLSIEYQVKKNAFKPFTRDTMKGACPKVPQQMNFSDCGVFTLQFVEAFFEDPLSDYTLPIKRLLEWFPQEVVKGKREAIANLIKDLMDQYTPNHGIILPDIVLNPKDKVSMEINDMEDRINDKSLEDTQKPTESNNPEPENIGAQTSPPNVENGVAIKVSHSVSKTPKSNEVATLANESDATAYSSCSNQERLIRDPETSEVLLILNPQRDTSSESSENPSNSAAKNSVQKSVLSNELPKSPVIHSSSLNRNMQNIRPGARSFITQDALENKQNATLVLPSNLTTQAAVVQTLSTSASFRGTPTSVAVKFSSIASPIKSLPLSVTPNVKSSFNTPQLFKTVASLPDKSSSSVSNYVNSSMSNQFPKGRMYQPKTISNLSSIANKSGISLSTVSSTVVTTSASPTISSSTSVLHSPRLTPCLNQRVPSSFSSKELSVANPSTTSTSLSVSTFHTFSTMTTTTLSKNSFHCQPITSQPITSASVISTSTSLVTSTDLKMMSKPSYQQSGILSTSVLQPKSLSLSNDGHQVPRATIHSPVKSISAPINSKTISPVETYLPSGTTTVSNSTLSTSYSPSVTTMVNKSPLKTTFSPSITTTINRPPLKTTYSSSITTMVSKTPLNTSYLPSITTINQPSLSTACFPSTATTMNKSSLNTAYPPSITTTINMSPLNSTYSPSVLTTVSKSVMSTTYSPSVKTMVKNPPLNTTSRSSVTTTVNKSLLNTPSAVPVKSKYFSNPTLLNIDAKVSSSESSKNPVVFTTVPAKGLEDDIIAIHDDEIDDLHTTPFPITTTAKKASPSNNPSTEPTVVPSVFKFSERGTSSGRTIAPPKRYLDMAEGDYSSYTRKKRERCARTQK